MAAVALTQLEQLALSYSDTDEIRKLKKQYNYALRSAQEQLQPIAIFATEAQRKIDLLNKNLQKLSLVATELNDLQQDNKHILRTQVVNTIELNITGAISLV